jgi:hypothetical protein
LNYTIEPLISAATERVIIFTKNLPVDTIKFVCKRDCGYNSHFIIGEIELIDTSGNEVRYWQGKNSIVFKDAKRTSLIERLYDKQLDTIGGSEDLQIGPTINLNPSINLSAITIVNAGWGGERLAKYDIEFYSNKELIGTKSLINHKKDGESITYEILLYYRWFGT